MKIQIFKYSYMPQCRLHHSFSSWMAVFLQKVFLKRTRINPYPYWNSPVCGRMYYLRYPVAGAYITGIQPEAVNPVINCHKCQPVVEVYVSNKRDMYRVPDISDGCSSICVRHCNPDYFTPCILKPFYLANRSADITCISVGHRLDNHRRIAANLNITNLYLPFASSNQLILPFPIAAFSPTIRLVQGRT